METPTLHVSPAAGTASPDPAPAPRFGRPEHTFASILLMAALSAAVLYGVVWSVRGEAAVARAWDFRTTPRADTPWKFPETDQAQDAAGVRYVTKETGPGPWMIMDLDSATVRSVRAIMDVTRVSDGASIPFSIEWYWASAGDIAAAKGGWPFEPNRGYGFEIPDPDKPNTLVVDLSRHDRWNGTIAQAFISVRFPEDETGPFLVNTRQIELLE